jgi:hypothetical protein
MTPSNERLAGYARQLSAEARGILTGGLVWAHRDAVTVAALERGGLLDEATHDLTADGREVAAILASEPEEAR